MEPKTSDQRAHGVEKERSTRHDGQPAPPASGPDERPRDAGSTTSKPHGTLHDQVKTMESEGQAQPQADELPPEERSSKGIPPLPEPNVEGVGEESGPSAEQTDEKGAKRA